MDKFIGLETIVRKVPNSKGAIVYAHSFMGRFQQKESLLEHYADYDFFALNLPAHGNSPLISNVQAYPGYAIATLQAFVEHYDVKNAIFMGHSLGGGIVASLNSLIPERIALNILETPACGIMEKNINIISRLVPKNPSDVDLVFAAMYADPQKTFGTHYDAAKQTAFSVAKSRYAAYLPTIEQPFIQLNQAVFDAGFAAIKAPTLVILGEKDGIIPPTVTMEHLKQINPKLEFAIIANAGHVPFYEQKETFMQLTDDFIKKHYHSKLA